MATNATNTVDTEIENLIHEVLNVTYLKEAFGSAIVYQQNAETRKIQQFCKQMSMIFTSFSVEQKESALRCYLSVVSVEPKSEQLENLFHVILRLVNTYVVSASI